MSEPFRGVINIDIKQSTPDRAPHTQPKAPEGAPSVLYIVLDDVGFGAMEPFGGPIQTPALQRIAGQGLTFTNFHTTALCSLARSCLMTGRNHITNAMSGITEITDGFPNTSVRLSATAIPGERRFGVPRELGQSHCGGCVNGRFRNHK